MSKLSTLLFKLLKSFGTFANLSRSRLAISDLNYLNQPF